ncbi:MAG: M28 family peptidase [Woeseia sp.]
MHNVLAGLVAIAIMAMASPGATADDTERLIAAMLGDTPVIDDLRELTDSIGGRVTGTPQNEAAVEWALAKFASAEVTARGEVFDMPTQWQEESVSARITGDVEMTPSVIAKPFSKGTSGPLHSHLVDGGSGTEADFERLGAAAKDAWVIVETPVLDDSIGLAGLFAEYGASSATDQLAGDAGAAGLIYMSSRPKNLLYRLPALASVNSLPILLMEREHAQRALRLLRDGASLDLEAKLTVDAGYAYRATNVIAEIRGSEKPDEIVLMGAHLDSHDLGTGALDNGANVAMLIDVARQITRLGLKPRRTIRFALWNGEEQGLVGSWKYTEQHEAELDNHVVAASFDIGTGRITGFFTGGRAELIPEVDAHLAPVAGLGPFTQVNAALVGTDNFDFMIEGVPNLIAAQQDANYASNYHAESDTFDKVDQRQLKLNSAIAAAVTWGFANSTARLPRLGHAQIGELIEQHGIEQGMRDFGVWDDWVAGERGRHD